MTSDDTSSLDDMLHELDRDAEFQVAFRRQKPYYDFLLALVKRRRKLGLTQQELADRLGRHQSTISRIESGEYDVRLSSLIDVAEALDARLDIGLTPILDLEQAYRTLELRALLDHPPAREYSERPAVPQQIRV